jgi:two-component system alkaline phosphatase synthesis response regulator PhoP
MSTAAPAAPHILVVEDEEHLAVGIEFNLQAEGFRVTTVADGPAALRLLQQSPHQFQLVVLDIMLPGMSGYAVCEALREAGNEVPVLMLSARTLTEDRIRGYDVGADQYLEKPFELEELLSMVRNMLARRGRHASAGDRRVGENYAFGRATVNFSTFQVVVGGAPVRLTPIELALVRYFAENEGRVISRDELLENVWGHASSPTTRTVDNFVMRLRKYFEVDPSQPRHFLSVRGAGYRFLSQPEGADTEAGREP